MKNKKMMILAGAVLAVLFIGGAFALGRSKSNNTGDIKTESSVKEQTVTVGILQFVSHPSLDKIRQGIEDGLAESGYQKGKNLKVEFQNGQGDQSKLQTMSEQLVNKKADIFVGIATPAVQALANATSDTPIVLGAIADPVGQGFVDSLKKPGGMMTGVSNTVPIDQQMVLAKELLPDAKKMAILYASSEDNVKPQVAEAQKQAKKQGFTTQKFAVPSSNEITQTIDVMDDIDFIYIPNDNVIANAMSTVVNTADKKEIPIIPSVDAMVEQGGIATVGIDQHELGVQTGKMTADILNGADPATTPVFVYKKGTTYVNKKQAEKYNINLPEEIEEKAEFLGED